MGASGAIIMGFFGAAFAALTLWLQVGWSGAGLALPFLAFAAIAAAALATLRMPGAGVQPSERAEKVIMWSSIGEGVGLFVAGNVVSNLHRPDLLLPSMALVVGLHFLPMGWGVPFRPFYLLGAAMLVAAGAGFAAAQPAGGEIAGFAAAAALALAAIMAVLRDRRARTA